MSMDGGMQRSAMPFMSTGGMHGMPPQQQSQAPQRPPREQLRASLFLGNLPQDWGQRDVLQLVQSAGQTQISGVNMKDGCCFVEFSDDHAAEKASRMLEGHTIAGKVLAVQVQKLVKKISSAEPAAAAAAPAAAESTTYPASAAPGYGSMGPFFTAASAPQAVAHHDDAKPQQQQQQQQTVLTQGFFPRETQQRGWSAAADAGAPPASAYAQTFPMHLQMQGGNAGLQAQNGHTGAHGYKVAGRNLHLNQLPHDLNSPSASPTPSPSNAHENSSILTGSHFTASADNSPARPKNNRRKKAKKSRPSVFVGGIRTDISERELRNFFGVFGKINHVTIKEGYAFLDFADDAAAHTAVEKCNGYVYDGKPLGVRIQDEGNRRTAQEAKKQGQNVSMVFKRMEEGHGRPQQMQQIPMQMPPRQQQGMQQQQVLRGPMPVRQHQQPPVGIMGGQTILSP